jgi:hypothetical protein
MRYQTHIKVFSGVEFLQFPTLGIMMMREDVSPEHLAGMYIPKKNGSVSEHQGRLYAAQTCGRSIATHMSDRMGFALKVPSLDQWLHCIDQIRPLQKHEQTTAPFSTVVRDKDINGQPVIEALNLACNGYRWENASNMYCRGPNIGRYWTSSPRKCIEILNGLLTLNAVTSPKRGYSLRLIANMV